jgi:hypothetical protein
MGYQVMTHVKLTAKGLRCPHAKLLWCAVGFSSHCRIIICTVFVCFKTYSFPMYTLRYCARMEVVVHLLILMGILLGWMTTMIRKELHMCKEMRSMNVWGIFGYGMLSRHHLIILVNSYVICSWKGNHIYYALWWDFYIVQYGQNNSTLQAKFYQCF